MSVAGPAARDDRRRAELLHAGPDSILTGLDALQILGIGKVPSPSGPVHVLIPTDRRRLGAGLVLVERTERLRELAVGVRSVAEAEARAFPGNSIWDRPTTRRRSSVTLG
jgi:hypothetical protein